MFSRWNKFSEIQRSCRLKDLFEEFSEPAINIDKKAPARNPYRGFAMFNG